MKSPLFAKIIPSLRLPRHLNDFWYTIPEKMEHNIRVGSLVHVPFHGKAAPGAVTAITSKQPEELKTFKKIDEIYSWFPSLTEEQLNLLFSVANKFFLSKATLLQSFLPTLPTRMSIKDPHGVIPAKAGLPAGDAGNRREDRGAPCVIQYTSIVDKYSYYRDLVQRAAEEESQALFLIPELHALQTFQQHVLIAEKRIIPLHRTLPKDTYLHNWLAIKQEKTAVIVGTRGAAFAPFSRLQYVILDDEESPSHKQWERNPRIHARDIAIELARIFHARLFFVSPVPTLETYFQILNAKHTRQQLPHPSITNTVDKAVVGNAPNITLVHRNSDERKKSISLPVENMLRKNIEHGQTTIILSHKKDLIRHFQQQFPRWKIEKFEIHSKKEISPYSTPSRIIIATTKALYQMSWKDVFAVILPFFDEFLAIPGFRSHEETLRMLFHIRNKLQIENNGRTEIILQTSFPQHPIILAFSTNRLDPWYKAELEERRKFCYPPYSRFMKLIYQHHSREQGEIIAKAMRNTLKQTLVDFDIQHIKILDPLLQKKTEQSLQKRWSLIIKNTLPESPFPEKFIERIPSDWIIDLDPLDLL